MFSILTKSNQGMTLLVLAFIGSIAAVFFILQVFSLIWRFIRPAADLKRYGAKGGAWALVTGASDGIGKGFAFECASKGFNVILMSRTKDKLDTIGEEIEKSFDVATKIVAIDASTPDAALKVFQQVQDMDIRLLVNNVGVQSSLPTVLAEQSEEDIKRTIDVNVFFTTHLTSLLIPILKKNAIKSKGKSAIINLSSVLSFVPSPMLSVYAASKAYNDQFSRCMSSELAGEGIDVLSVTPYYVASSMTGIKRTSISVIAPRHLARLSLQYIGHCFSLSPYWFHAVMQFVMRSLPESVIGGIILRTMKGARARWIKRMKKWS